MSTQTAPTAAPELVQRYSGPAISLHWIIALGVITNVTLAWLWPHMLPDDVVRPTIDVHKSIGVTILGLAAMRLLWRWANPPPPLPTGYAIWEVRLSEITHGLLYIIIFAMPLTGWIMDSAWKDQATHPMHYFGTFEFPRLPFIVSLPQPLRENFHTWFGKSHEYLAYALYVLFAMHVAGALKHQILDREPELQRMLPGK